MPRTARSLVGGAYYHVINRGNNRAVVFHGASEYMAFVHLMELVQERVPLEIVAACLMPSHFHLVVSPLRGSDLSRWMHWLLTTHSNHYHLGRGTAGRVWQGRFKAFPIEQDHHLLTVMRYVERNALRAGMVARAEDWPWSSLAWRSRRAGAPLLTTPPVPLPSNWAEYVNQPQTQSEVEALRECINGQRPFGSSAWTDDVTLLLGARPTTRRRGRPRRASRAPPVNDPGVATTDRG